MYASLPQTPLIVLSWSWDTLMLKNTTDTLSNLFGLIRAGSLSFHVDIIWMADIHPQGLDLIFLDSIPV